MSPSAAEDDRPQVGGVPVSVRQARLLVIVAEGGGNWDARRIDLTIDSRFGPGEGTVLQELRPRDPVPPP